MLLSDLASFPKGIIKMLKKFFVCIFLELNLLSGVPACSAEKLSGI